MSGRIALLFFLLLSPLHAASAGPQIVIAPDKSATFTTASDHRSFSGQHRPTFPVKSKFFVRLRKHQAMPLWQLINTRQRELFIGIDRDGTVGFHYSFGR